MKLVVVSHKECWSDKTSPSGYATNGGFPFQIKALSEIFDATTLVIPSVPQTGQAVGTSLEGHNLSVVALALPKGTGLARKVSLLPWILENGLTVFREIRRADVCHTPIPGDVGSIGMLLAFSLRKPLFVRHCGNWFVQKTAAEHFWKWFMEKFAGGRNVMMATGGAQDPPSNRNPNIQWIFSSSLTEQQIANYGIHRSAVSIDHPRLITVCRQEREKGAGEIIRCLPLLLDDFPEIKLDILGDGRALNDWVRLAATLGVTDRVIFHGNVAHSSVIEHLLSADIFCFPTAASEGFPKAVLEALACGLPVITTPISVLPLLIGKGCGIVLPERTPAALANAVRSLILAPSVYQAMSTRALEVASEYTLEQWAAIIKKSISQAWEELPSS